MEDGSSRFSTFGATATGRTGAAIAAGAGVGSGMRVTVTAGLAGRSLATASGTIVSKKAWSDRLAKRLTVVRASAFATGWSTGRGFGAAAGL